MAEMRSSTETLDRLQTARLDLETVCPLCAGTPYKTLSNGDVYTCTECNGDGAVPTEYGRQVLAFLNRHRRCFIEE